MDDIDRRLIALLRKDARTPIATLATRLERVRLTKGIANTETSILLATFR